MPHIVTEAGAYRVRVNGVDLPAGSPVDATNWSTRSSYESRGFLRFVSDDEYEGALKIQEERRKADEASPFASLSPSVQKALEAAGLKTVAEAQALKKEGLVALKGIGEESADKIMALTAEQA